MIRVEIRELRASDLEDVLSIEHSSFDQPWGAARFRWTAAIRCREPRA